MPSPIDIGTIGITVFILLNSANKLFVIGHLLFNNEQKQLNKLSLAKVYQIILERHLRK